MAIFLMVLTEIPQPLHLLISAEHAKSLDDARSLAEHLLETIRSEVVGSRYQFIGRFCS